MRKSFFNVTPDSGSGNGVLSVTADANQSGYRTDIVKVSGGGLLRL